MKIILPLGSLLLALFILGLSVLLGVYYTSELETFIDTATDTNQDIRLQACPADTVSFSSKSDTNCCRGDIVNGRCNGVTVCTQSVSSGGLPNCLILLKRKLSEKAGQFCPRAAPNYFEGPSKKGCTSAARNPAGTAPATSLQSGETRCYIYPTQAEELNSIDSCSNMKKAEAYTCPGTGGKPIIVQLVAGKPAALQCNFVASGSPEVCYEDASFDTYMLSNDPSYRTSMTNSQKLKFCSNAKAYYIDKSLTDAQLSVK